MGLRSAALVLAGVVVVATALPLGWLAVREPFTTSFMVWSRFSDPATGRACPGVDYRFVERRAIAPALRRAVVLAEDQRFLEHGGVDLRQVERVVEERGDGGPMRGASTLSQQLAKNLFLWPGRSWLRKGLEAWFTLWLELALSKQRILELYLNVAQFGPCVFGAEAAAQRYFGTSAAALTPRQAALLAAVLPSPGRISAADPGPYARQRTREILALMRDTRDAPWLRGL
ncbi:MAG: monofunctional biosynthetic peptidoglycan transglycosylase [Myxococcota bacterium]